MSKVPVYTKDQHFVPRMYLNGFSEIIEKSSRIKALLWQFDLQTMQQSKEKVDVDTICFEKDLYELIDSENEYIARNYIENKFGKIEIDADLVIKSIKEKSEKQKCLSCPSILSEEDKTTLIIFMTALQFRDPNTIDMGIKALQQTNPEMTPREMRNFTLMNLLPLNVEQKWDENTIILSATKRLCGMSFQIGIASEDIIFTSDRPIVMWPPRKNEQFNRPQAVVFPLTSRLVLYMFPMEEVSHFGKDWFTYLSKEQISDIQSYVASNARRWIFSKYPLCEEQLRIIREARKNKDSL